jgi:hypothetical protein
MPVIFIHGVAVRQTAFDQLSAKVLQNLRQRKAEADMPYATLFWGASGVSLRWDGRSIPGFVADDHLSQREGTQAHEPLSELKILLLADPLAELAAFADAGEVSDDATSVESERQSTNMRSQELLGKQHRLVEALQLALTPSKFGEVFLTSAVDRIVSAAARTSESFSIEELLPMVTRAITASLCRNESGPGGRTASATEWDETEAVVDHAVGNVLGGKRTIGSVVRESVLSVATAALRRGLRTRAMPEMGHFIGDTMVYLNDRARFLDAFYSTAVTAMQESTTPLWIVGHSLGGVMAFDLCCREPALPVARLATVGSQVGLFAEADLLEQRNAAAVKNERRVVPENVGQWINVYDENDMLSYRTAGIFDRGEDEEIPSGVLFPASHLAYWDNATVYNRIFV